MKSPPCATCCWEARYYKAKTSCFPPDEVTALWGSQELTAAMLKVTAGKGRGSGSVRKRHLPPPGVQGHVVRKGFLAEGDSTWTSKNKTVLSGWKGDERHSRHSKQMQSKSKDRPMRDCVRDYVFVLFIHSFIYFYCLSTISGCFGWRCRCMLGGGELRK